MSCSFTERFAFHEQAAEQRIRLADARRMAEIRIANRDIYIWEDGCSACMAAQTRPTAHGIGVSLVYTPADLRRKGYASASVAALSQMLLDSGRSFCALFADLANPTVNHIYQAIGYVPVADWESYVFGR